MENPKFTIFVGKDDQFYFNLKARNGEIVLKSEGYTAKHNCEGGIQSVKSNAPHDIRYQRLEAVDGQDYFNLVAENGEVIGVSETYTSEQARDHGIEVVTQIAPSAAIDDQA